MSFVIDIGDGSANVGGCAVFGEQLNLRSEAGPFAGPDHGPPVVGGVFFEQEQFKLAAGAGIGSVQPGGDYPRVVKHQDIPRGQVWEQIREAAMTDFTRFSVEHEQTRAIAPAGGLLGNEIGRQVEMKISGAHAASVTERDRSDNSHFAAIVNNF